MKQGQDEVRFVNNFQVDECSVPEGMTLAEWRRANAPPRKTFRARVRRVGRRAASEQAGSPADDR
ncbi:MAG: hypothetical protein H0W05_08195 [Thermoleophilaceae bacterium]|jgi:hypothetical protein|nr:hypothetical protein [Thermoleophilaceae bacterium]